MYDALNAICDKHGIFLRRDAIALGYTDKDLARAVRMRVLHKVRHGSYTFHARWDALTTNERHAVRAMAMLRTARADVVLSHTTALVLHDAPTWELPLDDVHLTRRDKRSGRRETGLAQHRGLLLPGDVVDVDGTESHVAVPQRPRPHHDGWRRTLPSCVRPLLARGLRRPSPSSDVAPQR